MLRSLWPSPPALLAALALARPAAAQSPPAAAPPPLAAAPSPPAVAPSAPAAAPSAPAAAPPAEAGAPAGSTKNPIVDVLGEQGTLQTRANPPGPLGESKYEDDDDEGWRPACAMPCRLALDASLEYRIAGPGVVTTNAFRLPPGRTNMRLDVETGSRGSRVTGIVFIPVGSTALGGGLLAAMIGGAFDQEDTLRGGLMVAGAGAFMMTAGILLVVNNRTSVRASSPAEPTVRLASGLALTPRGLVF